MRCRKLRPSHRSHCSWGSSATASRGPAARLGFWQAYCPGGCLTAVVALSAFGYEWYSSENLAHARDAAFSALVIAELLRAFGARSEVRTVWQIGLLSNRQLCVIVAASCMLQLALHHLPALQQLFGTAPVSLRQWSVWLVLGAVPLLVLELRKVLPYARRAWQA